MEAMDLTKENRVEVLRLAALSLHEENINLRRQLNAQRQSENAKLQHLLSLEERISQQAKSLYGDSSERRGFKLGESSKETTAPQVGHGPTEQPELPIVEVEHELDTADLPCPKCGDELQVWETQFETSEEIDIIEVQYLVVHHKRKKYRCGCGHIETALGPKKLQSKGRYSVGFSIDVAVKKYLEHLPLSRQAQIASRAGLKVTSQSLWDQLWAMRELLKPVKGRLLDYLHSKEVLGADETTWRLMNKGKSKKHYVWALCGNDAVLYHIANTRGAAGARPLLAGYGGRLMADDYSVYQSLLKSGGMHYTLDACWAHVRRKFIEAEDNEPIRSVAVVALIGMLYHFDKQAVGPPGSSERRKSLEEIRNTKSRCVVAALREWSMETRGVLPNSSFGKALSYMKNCFARLTAFLDDGRVSLDNNATERAIRGIVVGRKNHYGSKSKRGCEASALLYSLMESAKLAGVNPRKYLRCALDAALDGNEIPLPHELGK